MDEEQGVRHRVYGRETIRLSLFYKLQKDMSPLLGLYHLLHFVSSSSLPPGPYLSLPSVDMLQSLGNICFGLTRRGRRAVRGRNTTWAPRASALVAAEIWATSCEIESI